MRKRIWLRWVVILTAALFAASAGFSRALQGAAVRRYLIAHLEASFGRPVEVGRFNFSLLNGGQLEAQSVTVAEDPQFGNEYFLRAESLTAGMSWSALLAGRIEFGSVSLTRPSLNLVRDSQGSWNIERWLPPTDSNEPLRAAASQPPSKGPSPERLDMIEVDGGRINFKQGVDKTEFALLDVSGSAEQESPGRWRLDLEAKPMRVGVELQEIGMLRLRGTIGGTSARLQPADLNLTWRDVSLADALRLAKRFDYGMRGTMDLDMNARIAPTDSELSDEPGARKAQWSVSAVARLQGIHGWKLPPRGSDPSTNVEAEAQWRLGEPQVTIGKLAIEMPNTHVQGSGEVDWSHGLNPTLHVESSSVGLADVASWYRAMRPGVPQDLNLQGTLGVDATFAGWPLQFEQGAVASTGGVLTASSLPGPLRIGPVNGSITRGALDFAPTEISFLPPTSQKTRGAAASLNAAAPPNSFTLRGTLLPDVSGALRWPPLWTMSIEGTTPRVQDWSQVAQALGQPPPSTWTATGGFSLALRGGRTAYSAPSTWSGVADGHGITAAFPFLNQPLRLPSAHADISPSQLTLTLSGAQAFGTTWSGTVARKVSGPWTFDLSTDSLDATDLDRWLGPRARPGLLAALGFAPDTDSNAVIQARDAAVTGLSARGRLRVGEVALPPLRLDNFDGDVEVDGRNILVHKAQAGFFGGTVDGSFEGMLFADPMYQFQGGFDRVDLERLGRAVPSLSSRIAGTASATLNLTAHGVGRANLIASLEGAGRLEARNAEMQGVDLSFKNSAANPEGAPFVFASAKGSFRIKDGAIDDVNFVLVNSSRRFQADGRIDFSHLLTFQIRPLGPAAKSPASAPPESFVLAGTVEAPRLSVSEVPHSAPQTAIYSGGARR